jgi:type IV pilus assembly protein PilV
MKRLIPSRSSRRRAGFALLEVLIAVLVMSFGMLGIAGLLFATNRSNTSSILKQQAVQSAANIIDRMRANRDAALTGSYDVGDLAAGVAPTLPAPPAVVCSSATPCAGQAQLAAYDTWYWLTQDLTRLPLGSGAVATSPATGGGTQVQVTVQWDDSPAQALLGAATATGGAGTGRVVVTSVL